MKMGKRNTRKPRTKSEYHDGYFGFGGEYTPAIKKIRKRAAEGKCIACGEVECRCKRKEAYHK